MRKNVEMFQCDAAMSTSTLPSQHGTPIPHLQVDWDVWTRPAEKNQCQNLANVKKTAMENKNRATAATKKTDKATCISWTWGTRWFKLYFIPGSLKVTIPTFWFWVTFSPSLKEVTELQGNPQGLFWRGEGDLNHGSVGSTIISIYESIPLRVFHGDWKDLYIFIEQEETYMHALFLQLRRSQLRSSSYPPRNLHSHWNSMIGRLKCVLRLLIFRDYVSCQTWDSKPRLTRLKSLHDSVLLRPDKIDQIGPHGLSSNHHILVVGGFNPLKNMSQKWESFPSRGEPPRIF